jgi:exopolyphosphatase / guanosine-5'-triphosphate,3'-diphosphate pyrophosphatase
MRLASHTPSLRPLLPGSSDTGAMRLAAIDVGSNSLHMIVAQADADGGLTTLWRLKEMVGLGRMSFPSRRLSREAIDRAIIALRRFKHEAQHRECEKVLAIATSAVREAENGGEFIRRARQELKLNVRVVSAKEEARLIYLGVRHAVDLKGGSKGAPHLIIDIGGGSVEFIVGDKEHALMLESRKLGAARMTARFVKSDPIDPAELRTLLSHYDRELSPVVEQVKQFRIARVIGTSGTLENIATLCGGVKDETDGNGHSHETGLTGVVERSKLNKLVDTLLESRAKDRAKMPGLDEQRRDQILAGALLVNEIVRRLGIDEIHLCKAALREGILVDYLSRHLPELEIRRSVPDPRRRSVLDLARRCDWMVQHREQVAKLTLQLFDQLRESHELGRRERDLIEYGALLHEVGWHIGRKDRHKHAMYLILHGELRGFSAEEVRVIANIARYHRKSPPKEAHEAFATLSADAKRIVSVGAALLRVADGLDRSQSAVVSGVRCRLGKSKAELVVDARTDAELELWAARRNARYFEEVFGKSLAVRGKP